MSDDNKEKRTEPQYGFLPSTRKETLDSVLPHLDGKAFSYKPFESAIINKPEEIARVFDEKRAHFIMKGGLTAAWIKTAVQIILLRIGSKNAIDKLPVEDGPARTALLKVLYEKFDKLKSELSSCNIPNTTMTYTATSPDPASPTNSYQIVLGNGEGKNEMGFAAAQFNDASKKAEEIKYCDMNCNTTRHFVRVYILAALCGAIDLDEVIKITSTVENADEIASSIINGVDEALESLR